MSGGSRPPLGPLPYSDYGGVIAQHQLNRFAPYYGGYSTSFIAPRVEPSYGRYSNSYAAPRGLMSTPVRAQSGDVTSTETWLTRADRQALWDHSRAEVNRLRSTHVTILQRDNRRTFWAVNMEQCQIPWSELRLSEVPPQFHLLYNPRTGEHDCVLSLDLDDRRWMD